MVRLELIYGQATPFIPEEGTIISHPIKKVLRAWWNLALQMTWAKLCVHLAQRHPASFAGFAKTRHPL